MDQSHTPKKAKSIFDILPAKQSFWLGFLTAILSLGTLGFVILGSMLLQGGSISIAAGVGSDSYAAAPSAAEAAPSAVAQAPTPEPPAGPLPEITDEDHLKGSPDAKITIVEYSDFECPFCSRFHPTVQQALDEYPDDVNWVFRHFPLSFHANAESAANASECAAEQGKFWEFGDELYANQTSLNTATYEKIAGDLGINNSQFQDCISSNKYADKVQAQSQGGAGAGVTGTPGSFIVGPEGDVLPIRGALPYSSIKAGIDQLLG